jgi:hypothetical protein
MKNHAQVLVQKQLIDRIRGVEAHANLSEFTQGQLSGAQQALYWVLDIGMSPDRAILTDDELTSIQAIDIKEVLCISKTSA